MTNTTQKNKLSEHFSKEEMSYSRIAVENGLDNEPPPAALQALGYLATHLLEPLRQIHNGPIAILSGYRSDTVNRLAGGVATSQHRKGEAADCYIPEGPEHLLEILKKSGLPFDQAILYRKRRFLHISLKEQGYNRMQVLFYTVLCLFVFLGCGTKKHAYRSESISKTATEQKDSTSLAESVRQTVTKFLEYKGSTLITIAELSKPDSVDRQYITRLTRIDIDSERKQSVTTDENTDKQEIATSMARKDEELNDSVTDHSRIDRKSVLPGWLFLGVVILLVFLFRMRISK